MLAREPFLSFRGDAESERQLRHQPLTQESTSEHIWTQAEQPF